MRRPLALVATAAVVVICLCPSSWLPTPRRIESVEFLNLDKLVHFSMYAMFGLAWMLAAPLEASTRSWSKRVIVAGVALAIGTELAQGTVFISRDPNAFDCLANVTGLVVATLVTVRLKTSTRGPAPDGASRELPRAAAAVTD